MQICSATLSFLVCASCAGQRVTAGDLKRATEPDWVNKTVSTEGDWVSSSQFEEDPMSCP